MRRSKRATRRKVTSTAAPSSARRERKAERVKCPSPPALKKLGYWTVQIEAGNGTGDHLPLCQELFSTQDPAYQALGEKAWTRTFQSAIERVLAHLGHEGIWLMDRGFDDIVWMSWMHANVQQTVIRMKANRLVHPGTKQEKAMNVGRLAETLEARHTTQIRYVDKSNHQEKFRSFPFTWAPIWVEGVDHALYLIVAHTGRKRPLLLVTDHRPESSEDAGELIQAYLERWGIEIDHPWCTPCDMTFISDRQPEALSRIVPTKAASFNSECTCVERIRDGIDRNVRGLDYAPEVRPPTHRPRRVVRRLRSRSSSAALA